MTSSEEQQHLLNSEVVPKYQRRVGRQDVTLPGPTPLDKGQILLLTLARMAEPITFTILLPFVNDMVLDTGSVPVQDVGFYVGGIETAFSLTQIFVLYAWGSASDKYGRKPVLILSLLGAFVASSVFGFAERIWVMYLARFIAGIFGGNSVVIRLLFSENSDATNRAKAFSFLAFGANLGNLIGPIVGGYLAKPSQQFPNTLGKMWLFQRFPYSLPCLAAGCYVGFVMILCIFFLNEPHHKEEEQSRTLREILDSTICIVLLNWVFTATATFCTALLFPLFLFTPVPLGGFSLGPSQIASFLAASALAQALWLLLIMPELDRILGTRILYRICTATGPIFSLFPPLANAFARVGSITTSWTVMWCWVVIGASLNITFTSSQLLINDFSPPGSLGAVNGVAMTLAAATKAVAPAALNAIFALGVRHQIMRGYLAWVVLATFGAIAYILTGMIPKRSRSENHAAIENVIE